MAGEEGADVCRGGLQQAGAGGGGGPGEVRGDDAVACGKQRIAGGRGFGGEDVVAGACNPTCIERLGKGRLIDKGPAAVLSSAAKAIDRSLKRRIPTPILKDKVAMPEE